MKTRIGALSALVLAYCCATAAAAPITVNVRVEGAHKTIFARNVKTDAHSISKDSTGAHPCNGTNNGANKTPGPTVTGALDDASKVGHFTWSATWYSSLSDFFVTRIGPDAGAGSSYWTEALNFKDTTSGGCQVELKPGDQVLLYFASKPPKYTLELTGGHKARVGKSFKLRVHDGKTGKPVRGASVRGKHTNAHGVVTLRFTRSGVVHLKATLAGSVRSNSLTVTVRP